MPLRRSFVVPLLVLAFTHAASAQVIGVFRWQTLPFCNVVTLTVAQQGGLFTLTGSDDLCGAGVAPVTGTAVVNGATVAMGMTVALPSGAGANLTASIALASVSGPWQDADGRSGTFQFLTGIATSGAPRPAPASAALITSAQLSPAIFSGSGSASTVARGDHNHDARYAARQVRVHKSGTDAQAFAGPNFIITGGDCLASSTNTDEIRLGLDVPFGAALSQVVVTVSATTGALYFIDVLVKTPTTGGYTKTPVLSANGVGNNLLARHTMTRVTPVVVGAEQIVELRVSTSGTTGLCAAEVAYTLAPTP